MATVTSVALGIDNEHFENVFDQNTETKWCVRPSEFNEDGGTDLILEWGMTEPVKLAGYIITTANDESGRNPEVWTLSARNDAGADWTVIDTVEAGDLPFDYFADSKFFEIDNPGPYQYYKLHISENFAGDTISSVLELKLYAE